MPTPRTVAAGLTLSLALGGAVALAPWTEPASAAPASWSATHASSVCGPDLAALVHEAALADGASESATLTATKAVLRDLWVGHVFWVRSVVVARFDGNAAAEAAAEAEVVANAKDLAASIEPFYGAEARDALFELLAGHYGAVKAYLDAASGDTGGEQAALDALLDNAAKLAGFLSTANPNWPEEELLELLQMHGGHHIGQIEHLAADEYAEEAEVWSAMTGHMYVIADALAEGLAAQFPDRF